VWVENEIINDIRSEKDTERHKQGMIYVTIALITTYLTMWWAGLVLYF
jgi:hypothetical protein